MLRSIIPSLLISCMFLVHGEELKTDDVRRGDLLFIASAGSGGMGSAIAAATASGSVHDFVHVAIIDTDPDGSLWAIEATPGRGVSRHPLDTLIQDNRLPDGTLPYMEFVHLDTAFPVDSAISRALGKSGQPYDFYYLPDNAAVYCSELVYDSYLTSEGGHIFPSIPMNFKSPDGTYPDFWVSLFAKLGRPIPQGCPGTNPQQLYDFLKKQISVSPPDDEADVRGESPAGE